MKPNILRALPVAASYAVILALTACAVSVETDTAQDSRSLLARLPSGSTAIGWIDVEAIAAAIPPERWAEYKSVVESDENWQDIERFAEATGLDPRTDLRQIAIAAIPKDEDGMDAMVLISATFDQERMESFLERAETESYDGHTIYRIEDEVWGELTEGADQAEAEEEEHVEAEEEGEESAEEDDPAYLVILDSETLLFGDDAGVRLGIDIEAGNRDSINMDPHINDLVTDVAGEGQIWFVATREAWEDELDEIPAGMPVPANLFEGIETVTIWMRMSDGIAMRLAASAGTAEDAKLLADTINGLVAMGKMMLQSEQPEVFQILDRGISVGADDRTFSIDANLTEEDIDTLRALTEEQAREQSERDS